ncbi:MAG: TPM domain-containing protein, partial [Muribaculaceae bacterium]|nr:TPM domain-containing protein [Muribaculaceae bacterium]
TMVVVVTGIEGGDCFDFAHRLGKEKGVGQKGRDNGLVVLLSTEERCVQFVTGYGLEGVLPDAICKRIQSKYMVQHLGKSDWNTGMIEGIRALNGYLNGSMTNELQEESEDDLGFIIMGLLFLSPIFFILYRVFKPSKPRCPQCKKRNTTMTKSNTLSKTKDYEVVKKIYTCQDCGHTFEKEEKINFPKDDGFNNTSGRVTPRRSSYNNTPRGGSFGGGSFGGGGAGSRF